MSRATASILAFLASAGVLLHAVPARGATPMTNVQEVVSGNTVFATDLYSRLKSTKGNLFFSPYSISTALAMTYGGARGNTAQQMASVLHFTVPPEALHAMFAELDGELDAIQKKGKVQISVANSLWPQQGHPFLPEYIALLKQDYGTSVTPLDYVGATETARKTINDWVEQKTNHKITDLIKPGVLSSLTRLVLANAIYFKGHWASQFDPKQTANHPFHIASGPTTTCKMMTRSGDYAYAETPDFQVAEFPYAGGDLSMIVLLPRATDGIASLENEITEANLTEWTSALRTQEIDVYLPKFKLTSEFRLGDTLAAMGMTDAFDRKGKADFSGMDGTNLLFISEVMHKAFVDVNEEGTEAAAATGVAIEALGVKQVTVFRADHSFLFLIRDKHTGSILFLGRVMNPVG